jgi:hypothetical protein
MAAAVISSWVGPMPRVVKTSLYLLRNAFTGSTIMVSISGTTRASMYRMPMTFSQFAKYCNLASCVLPERISLPIINKAAVGEV